MSVIQIVPPRPFSECYCVALHGVFTEVECQGLIQRSEVVGYEKALVNIGDGKQELMEDYRNSDRAIIDDVEFAKELFDRVQHFLPETFQGRTLIGLNERMRFLRYDPGHYFKPHYDGPYVTPDRKQASKMTLMLYLNEGFKGGETTFLPKPCAYDEGYGKKPSGHVDFIPKTGSVLMFFHGIYHQGSDVIEGRKYCVRTDVMYTKKKEPV